jgi:hypothetical protein
MKEAEIKKRRASTSIEKMTEMRKKKRRLQLEVNNLQRKVDVLCDKALESKDPKPVIVEMKARSRKYKIQGIGNFRKGHFVT